VTRLDVRLRADTPSQALLELVEGAEPARTLRATRVQVAPGESSWTTFRFEPLDPPRQRLVLRVASVPGLAPVYADASKDDRYPWGRLYIDGQPAFPDQDLRMAVYGRDSLANSLDDLWSKRRAAVVSAVGLGIGVSLVAAAGLARVSVRAGLWPETVAWLALPAAPGAAFALLMQASLV